jgi:hypothetical protein
MNLLSILGLAVAVTLALCFCSGSSSSSGYDARQKFESRTGISLPSDVTGWEFASVHVGDTFGEYYRFQCAKDVFLSAAKKLQLTADPLPGYPGSTHWGRAVGESSPNDPSWWKLAAATNEIFHKEDYSNVAHRSVMAFWYHEESKTAYMSVDFWD